MPQNSRFLELLAQQPPEQEAWPGVTIADLIAFFTLGPVPAGSRYEEHAFMSGRPLKLLVYARDEPAPGIVFIHGGGWRDGAPDAHLKDCHEFAARGYVTASIEYRLSGEATWPAAFEDVMAALAYMRDHAGDIGLDPARVALAGGSAGGHLSLLAAMREPPVDVRAVTTWFPMTDMRAPGATGWAKECVALFLRGGDFVDESSPLTYVRPGIPPVLTMTGSDDPVTPLPMIREFHDALDLAGVENELVVFDGQKHAFTFHPGLWAACFAKHVVWLEKHLS